MILTRVQLVRNIIVLFVDKQFCPEPSKFRGTGILPKYASGDFWKMYARELQTIVPTHSLRIEEVGMGQKNGNL